MRVVLLKFVLSVLSKLPLRWTHQFATLLGHLLARRTTTRLTCTTHVNLRLCYPQLSTTAHTQLVSDSLIETCKTFSELGALWLWPPQRTLQLVRQVSNETVLQQALQQGNGVILLTPHFAAWELAGLYASAHYPMTALYRPPKLSALHPFILQARERAGGRYVATDKAGIKALMQTLKRGEVVGILPDQVPTQAGSGVFAPFMGIPADTMTLVARLAHKTQAPVIFTYAQRLALGKGFHIHFFAAPTEIAAQDVTQAAAALNQGVAQCIAAAPSQYQWSYKRFKHPPPGSVDVYLECQK